MNKILVIEDEQFIRDVILEILEAENFEAISAENGEIGVELAQEIIPDLIICDIMMPKLDGYGVLNELRQYPVTATIPFIFLTAKADKADWRQGMDLGADDYLTKPFSNEELLGAIASRLEKQEAIGKSTEKKLDTLRQSLALSLPHELLRPLNDISDFSKELWEKSDVLEPFALREIAEHIQADSELLHRLIHNFLLYAELEIAATDPQKLKALRSRKIISSQAVITDTALQKSKQYGREADLHLELQEASVQMSQADLQKIVEEIIDNAFKFSDAGTPVRVSSILEQNIFTIQVMDNGRGMTTEQIASLGAYIQFERRLYEQQGSGLGLSIIKRVAEVYGGEMVVESIPKQQTIVQVILPSNS
ncbi:MAG: response regulator [Aphanothece sp. CMT-3BRIN-NPC111]|nr:response regulator [Aphanothece sp. CMT-3BRIN-NPC111]